MNSVNQMSPAHPSTGRVAGAEDPMLTLLEQIDSVRNTMDSGALSEDDFERHEIKLFDLYDRVPACQASTVEGGALAYVHLKKEWATFFANSDLLGSEVITALIASVGAAIGARRADAARPARAAVRRNGPSASDRSGDLLTTHEAAARLRCSTKTLERWRSEGSGPEYSKPRGRVLYAAAVIEAFITAGSRKATREPAG